MPDPSASAHQVCHHSWISIILFGSRKKAASIIWLYDMALTVCNVANLSGTYFSPDPFPWQWLLKAYQQGYGTKLTSHSQYWHATFGSCPRGEPYTLAYHLGAQERCKRLGWPLSCSRPVLFQGTCWLHKIHSEGSSFSLSYHSLQSTIILQNVENEIKAVVGISK